ncbi:MAG: hypothetical protein SFV22_04970 [Saprospiraceae bacterium]|nr:hypothetical protein [Saprospiraceae bacterium]
MIDNKLFELYKSFNSVEKRECATYLKSAYHNRRDDVWRLWELLPQKKSAGLSAETLFEAIYPGRRFQDAQWRHLQSFLTVCMEQFLAQRAWEKTPLLADLHLAPVYREKNLQKPLEHTLRRAAERMDKMPRDPTYYHYRYLLEWERYNTALLQQGRSQPYNLEAVNRAFDVYTSANKLRLACLMESHRAVFQVEYDQTFLPDLLHFLEKSDLLNVPLVALYFYCYQSLTKGSEADFRAFRLALEQQGKDLPEYETRTFTLLAINYCIRRLNTGEERYVREAFDLYRIGLETRALLENGILSRFAFKNMVALGLKLEEFEWVERFIADFESFLEEKYRSAQRDYNLAKLYFTQKNYHQAMPLLARVGESDLLLNLDSRVLLLKMYYETGEFDALDALLASFKILLLRKKKVIGYHSAHYLHTLRFIQKLVRLNPNDKQAAAAFRAEVEADKSVIEKDWLLEQAR